MNYNRVILAGHVTRDPELRYLQSGTAVCDFGIAVNRKRKDRDDEVSFVDCTAWARTAEVIAEYVRKGSGILVDGRLQQDRWQTDDGQNRSKIKVVVENFQFGERGGGDAGATEPPAAAQDIPF